MAFRVSLASVAAVLGLVIVPAAAQAQLNDRVQFMDRATNKAQLSIGVIQNENPVEIEIKAGAAMTLRKIPVTDVVDVSYEAQPQEVKDAASAESKKDFDKALKLYEDGLKKLPANHKFLPAHVRFKIAKLTAQQTEMQAAGYTRGTAIAKLNDFRKEFPESRQIVECLEILSRLLLAEGQATDDIMASVRLLKGKHGAALGTRLDLFESQILTQEAENLLRDNKAAEAKKKYADAQAKLEVLLKDASAASALDIRVALAACKAGQGNQKEAMKDLEDILSKASDDRTRATALLGLGDCHRLNKNLKEAMWSYLWVEVVYPQDREQTAKALYHLQELFDQLKDPEHAEKCRDRLNKDFAGTRYQRMLAGK